MKRTAILLAAVLSALLATQVRAEGFYLGAAGSGIWSKGGSLFFDTINEDTSAGGKIYGGYQWDRFGMEIGLHGLGKYDILLTTGTKFADVRTSALSVAGTYTLPVGQGFLVNVKLGLAFTQAEFDCVTTCNFWVDTKIRAVSGVVGLGLAARLTGNLRGVIDIEHFGNVKHKVTTFEYNEPYDVLSVGLRYDF
jgi:hypothetical protein